MLIDTHCHIDGNEFPNKQSAVKNALDYGVGLIVNSGSDYLSSYNSMRLSESFPSVFFSAGVHPDGANDFDENTLTKIKQLVNHEKCVAIGEIGLDYHYEPFDKEKQKATFSSQLDLAKEINLPVIIHSRDAHADTYEMIKQSNTVGTMHCFSGSVELAKLYLDLGYYISFGGTLTFKNNVRAVEVLKYAPLDRVLTETDSPYLSPEPFRGKLNHPSNVRFVYKKIAEIKNVSDETVENAVYENALRLFGKINRQ